MQHFAGQGMHLGQAFYLFLQLLAFNVVR